MCLSQPIRPRQISPKRRMRLVKERHKASSTGSGGSIPTRITHSVHMLTLKVALCSVDASIQALYRQCTLF